MSNWRLPALSGIPTTVEQALRSLADFASEPSGVVKAYAGTVVPKGYLRCNGSLVSRSTYSSLFAAIGTTWGAGDGVSTFALPSLTGRFMQGSATPGTYGGTSTHNHGLAAAGATGSANIVNNTTIDHTPPYASVIFIIKV